MPTTGHVSILSHYKFPNNNKHDGHKSMSGRANRVEARFTITKFSFAIMYPSLVFVHFPQDIFQFQFKDNFLKDTVFHKVILFFISPSNFFCVDLKITDKNLFDGFTEKWLAGIFRERINSAKLYWLVKVINIV